MRQVLPTLVLILAGCAGAGTGESPLDAFPYLPDRRLWIALEAFREGRGQWPSSVDDLSRSSFLREELHLERYVNLKFERLPDETFVVSFDRYTLPGGEVTCRDIRIDVSPDALGPTTRHAGASP